MEYLIFKWLHILSSTFLFGTGVGSAFYLLFTSLSRDIRAIAVVARYVVIADWVFTTPTILIQPLTGWRLKQLIGTPWEARWLAWSIALFVLATVCWLPVVWIQLKMRDIAREAAAHNADALPAIYWRYLAWWVALGTIAFVCFVAVFYLMVAKPR
jgi:uncharacterized membrane protein